MDFARKQLEKYGWSEGKGLGRNEDGISSAIKPKLKFDNAGVGHNVGEQFTNNWWEKLFNNAADNIKIDTDNNEVRMKLKSKDSLEISTKGYSTKDLKKNGNLKYGSFLKTAKLTGTSVEHYDTPSFSENKPNFQSLTDDELFAACGGRTAHKGARHGLKLSGKLSRIEKQEKLLMRKMKKMLLSDNKSDKGVTEKKLKKLKKQKEETKEKYIPILEDSMESTCSNGLKKKKKRKSVSFSETVTVTPFYVEADANFETGDHVVRYENINEPNLENTAGGSDEGIEQDIENNNNEYSDNNRSFEVGQFNINDLSKAERKKLKQKRKLEARKNTSTGIFLQKLEINLGDDESMLDFEEKDVNLKKRKYLEDSEQGDIGRSSKTELQERYKKKKDKAKRKKQKKVEDKLNSIVKSLDSVCRISESE